MVAAPQVGEFMGERPPGDFHISEFRRPDQAGPADAPDKRRTQPDGDHRPGRSHPHPPGDDTRLGFEPGRGGAGGTNDAGVPAQAADLPAQPEQAPGDPEADDDRFPPTGVRRGCCLRPGDRGRHRRRPGLQRIPVGLFRQVDQRRLREVRPDRFRQRRNILPAKHQARHLPGDHRRRDDLEQDNGPKQMLRGRPTPEATTGEHHERNHHGHGDRVHDQPTEERVHFLPRFAGAGSSLSIIFRNLSSSAAEN